MSTSPDVPRPVQIHNADHANALTLFACAATLAAIMPATLVGAAVAWAMWRVTRPDIVTKWVIAGLGAATVAGLHAALSLAWPWRLLAGLWLPTWSQGITTHVVASSVPVELLAGPAVLVLFLTGQTSWRRTVHGQEWARYREMDRRRKALDRKWEGPSGRANPAAASSSADGLVLGTDTRSPPTVRDRAGGTRPTRLRARWIGIRQDHNARTTRRWRLVGRLRAGHR